MADVFEHVGGQDNIEAAPRLGRDALIQVRLHEVADSVVDAGGLDEVDPGDLVTSPLELLGQQAAGATQIEHLAGRSRSEEREDATVRTVWALLELVLVAEGDALTVAEARLVQSVPRDVGHDVSGVPHPLDVADLVAVVSRNRYLPNQLPGVVHLNDDLGVEVEPVGILLERNVLQRLDAVRPVARMELRQTSA